MALPTREGDSTLRVDGLRSRGYVDMTLSVMEQFGVHVQNDNYSTFFIRGSQNYQNVASSVEGDWSGGAFLLVAAAIAGEATIVNLNPDSLQPDTGVLNALRSAGASVKIDDQSIFVSKGVLSGFNFDATEGKEKSENAK